MNAESPAAHGRPFSFAIRYQELPVLASMECVRTVISQARVGPSFSSASLLLGYAYLGCP